ncbi:asparaginase [Oryzibacter oryziterrae]|uniref:asparaginase n=1 Tax=Oryzibacter oryziterrae TaxID=2766474 RepID=UPI001F46D5D4|nr:asparaginase [Oryzibacter oryziterrae]
MSNPVLVEVTRGGVVESRHRGAVAVVDGDGSVLWSLGDIDRPSFPRSAVKPFQALPFIESGAADKFGFGNAELAYSFSSHNGEARHIATTRSMLAKAGLDESCLVCGAHWPNREDDHAAIHAAGGKPLKVHNNCSGKHAGFLCTAVAMGVSPEGYHKAGHPVMDEVIAAGAFMTGTPHAQDICGIDGCSIPTFAISTRSMAHGFARFVTGVGLGPERAKAADRLRLAAAADPFMVAGTGRFCTRAMAALGDRAMVKTGAEGVFTAAIKSLGLGVALKIDDGAARASEAVTAAILMKLLKISPDDAAHAEMTKLANPTIKTWAGELAGEIRVTDALIQAMG